MDHSTNTPTEKPQGAGAVPPRIRATVNNLPYLSLQEHQQLLVAAEARHKELMERAVGEAKTEEWKAVADELEEIYGTSTGERMALIGHIRDTYKELKAARAASSPGEKEGK